MNLSHLLQPVPAHDWITIAILFVGIALLIALSEWVRHKLNWSEEFSRKLVHILVGVLMFFSPVLLVSSLPLVLIATFFTVLNLVATKKGWLKGMHGERKTYGTVYYPLSFLILVVLCWENYKIILIASLMILAIADALAAIVGESIKNPRKYVLISEQKSFEGSVTMFFVSTLMTMLALTYYPFNSVPAIDSAITVLWISVITGVIATAAEALSSKGSDNLTVPIFVAIFLYFMLGHSIQGNIQLTMGIIFGAIFAYFSLKAQFLNNSGAVATFLLAAVIFGFGGWKWTLPILLFFILSSLLSKLGREEKVSYDTMFEKGSKRDYAQVIANGGVAGILVICYLFYQSSLIYIFYLAAVAAAMADTWATEIGTLSKQQPRLFSTFKKVAPGTSGGITFAGLVGATLGAFLIALCGWQFLDNFTSYDIPFTLVGITLSGFFASLFDSLVGATVQAQYRCPTCHKMTEKRHHCDGIVTRLEKGFKWMNNDMVNLLNTVSALSFMYIFL